VLRGCWQPAAQPALPGPRSSRPTVALPASRLFIRVHLIVIVCGRSMRACLLIVPLGGPAMSACAEGGPGGMVHLGSHRPPLWSPLPAAHAKAPLHFKMQQVCCASPLRGCAAPLTPCGPTRMANHLALLNGCRCACGAVCCAGACGAAERGWHGSWGASAPRISRPWCVSLRVQAAQALHGADPCPLGPPHVLPHVSPHTRP
jgi:hypothetical protein